MRSVITFHAIDERRHALSYPARGLARMLAAFARAQIPVLPLDQLLAPETVTGVALTFDDGMASLHEAALPILREYGAPAHLFLTTRTVEGDNRWEGQPAAAPTYRMLDWDQIEALHAAGVAIESHTAGHPDLRTLSPSQIVDEMAEADDLIARRLGRRPAYFAYPYGYHDAKTRAAASARYAAAFTTELAYLRPGTAPERLPRLDSHYMRHPATFENLNGTLAQGYMALRRGIRILRGRE